jgi:hypothetical protein
MKDIVLPDRVVHSEGYVQSASMKIKATGRSFRNLVDSIYSKKEETVVRELIANALDSHAKAGIPHTPIKVFLPSHFEPNFIVRDYGVGMTHDFIMEHYSTLFESTKQDTNEETGMFGIGSKSPLALVDAFTLRAFDGEQERVYEICIPQDGVPRIDHALTKDSDEPCGIEVSVPLDYDNREGVVQGLANQHFCWFDKPLAFEGAGFDHIKLEKFGAITRLSERIYLGDSEYQKTWDVYVRQGAAVYPVEYSMRHNLDKAAVAVIEELCEQGRAVLIDLPIGTCAVTMSREALQYDEVSRKNLIEVINTNLTHFKETINGYVGRAFSYLDAIDNLMPHFVAPEDVDQLTSKRMMLTLAKLSAERLRKNYEDMKAIDPTFDGPPPHEHGVISKSKVGFKCTFHRGHLWRDTGVQLQMDTLKKSSAEVSLADLVYVIPSHFQWRESVQQHVEKVARAWKLPPAKLTAIEVVVIRTARRNVDLVIDELKSMGVYDGHYGEKDVPAIFKRRGTGVVSTNGRNACYPWVNDQWGGRIDPCLTEPAYYAVRHQTSTEIVLPKETGVRAQIKNGAFKRLRKQAIEAKIIDPTLPLYRVTARQAIKFAAKTNWKCVTDVIHEAVSKELRDDNVRMQIRASALSHHNNGKVSRVMNVLYRSGNAELLGLTLELLKNDSEFRYGTGVTFASGREPESDKRKRDYFRACAAEMYNSVEFNGESVERSAEYDKLHTEYEDKFYFMQYFADAFTVQDDDVRRNMVAYMKGMLAEYTYTQTTLRHDTFDELTPFIEETIRLFEDQLILINSEREDDIAA